MPLTFSEYYCNMVYSRAGTRIFWGVGYEEVLLYTLMTIRYHTFNPISVV